MPGLQHLALELGVGLQILGLGMAGFTPFFLIFYILFSVSLLIL